MTEKPQESAPDVSNTDLLAAIGRFDDDLHGIRNGDILPLKTEVTELRDLVNKLVESHNGVGQNVAWLVQNVAGLFQMFNDPNIMSTMMNTVMGGIANGGRAAAAAGTEPTSGPATG